MQSARSTKPRIPKRLIPYSECYLEQRMITQYHYATFEPPAYYPSENNSRAIEVALLKYYPKSCRILKIDQQPKAYPVTSRIRQIKILRHLVYDFSEEDDTEDCFTNKKKEIIKRIKSLLQSKTKSVKSLPIIGFQESGWSYEPRQITIPDMCPFFPKIKVLDISASSPRVHNPNESFMTISREKEVLRSYGYFWESLKHVQHLELTTFSPNLWLILPYIQSSTRFLSSLKSFKLIIFPLPFTYDLNYPRVLFQVFLRNHDLLKYVTHLTFRGSKYLGNFHYYGHQIQSIIECCSRLVYLSFPIQHDFCKMSLKRSSELNLTPLKSLQNIAILNLSIYRIPSFIKAFEFPLSLKKLTLYFASVFDLEKIQQTSKDGSTEITNQVLLDFFVKFRELNLLRSFELITSMFTEKLLNDFALPIIHAVLKLERFDWKFRNASPEGTGPFDLSIFLDGITPLKDFKSFKIAQKQLSNEIRSKDLIMTFAPLKSYSFPNIESVSIDTWISQDFDFKKFFQVFSDGSQITLKEASFAKVHVQSLESFNHILGAFKNFGQYPSLKVNLGMILRINDLKEITDNLKGRIYVANNVTIALNIVIFSPDDIILSPEEVHAMQTIFCSLKLNIDYKLTKNGKGKGHIIGSRRSFIPLIKDNFPC